MQPEKSHIPWIDAAKGISIAFVVLGHCADKNGEDVILLHLCMFAGVSAFFFLSGMTFCRSTEADRFPWFDHRSLRRFSGELIRRIVVPYFFWSAVSIAVYAVIGSWTASQLDATRHNFDVLQNLGGMFYANSGTGYMEWNRPLWFLPCLAVTELLWYLILRGLSRLRSDTVRKAAYLSVLAVSFLWLLLSSVYAIRLKLPWETETALSMMGVFGAGRWAGCLPAFREQRAQRRSGSGAAAAVFAASVIFLLVMLRGTEEADFRADIFSRPYLLLPEMAAGVTAAVSAGHLFENSVFWKYLGNRTLSVLVMHRFAVTACKLVRPRLDFPVSVSLADPAAAAALTPVMTAASDLVMAAAVIAACLAAERVISSICPQVFGRRGSF